MRPRVLRLRLTGLFELPKRGEVGVGPGPSGLGAVFWIRLPRGDGPEPVIGKDPFLEQLWQGGSNGQS